TRPMTSFRGKSLLLALAALLGDGKADTPTNAMLAKVEVAAPRPTDSQPCACADPIYGADVCYEPVCPPGYFKCCFACAEAKCKNMVALELSWRGELECIKCHPGDFCDGCDTFSMCPANIQPGREGSRVSAMGSTRVADCESCGSDQEADFQKSTCIDRYSSSCNV
ncbi:unnamed protein product, partial [Polarella glacialis]